jgi:hypothetical protein
LIPIRSRENPVSLPSQLGTESPVCRRNRSASATNADSLPARTAAITAASSSATCIDAECRSMHRKPVPFRCHSGRSSSCDGFR